MKKLFAILLAVAMLASMATVASAAETTLLETSVPPATYKLNIPAKKVINFGSEFSSLGNITVTEADGFAEGKNLKLTINYSELTCEGVSTTIPFTLSQIDTGDFTTKINSGDALVFKGRDDGMVYEKAFVGRDSSTHQNLYVDSISVGITSQAWGKALAGTYTATITYTAEVVVE